MDSIELNAYAKINLGLDVLRKREDGYHEVKMVMQSIQLHDRLKMKKITEDKIKLECGGAALPLGPENLIYRAVQLIREEYSISGGVSVELTKQIPIAAGLAGGSTDAAAALRGMNQLFSLGISEDELSEHGVKIGADVPFCLLQGTALSEGIGERLTRLPELLPIPILIAKPPISVSTKYVYEHLTLDEMTDHPKIETILEGIRHQDIKKIASSLGNLLENVTVKEYPIIQKLKQRMMELGAENALMSGSGPTVFGLFLEEETAKEAYRILREEGMAEAVALTSPVGAPTGV